MWVAELGCDNAHVFEAWFGSHHDYESQRSRGLVACPICASLDVSRKVSAPRLNFGAQPLTNAEERVPEAPSANTPQAASEQAQWRETLIRQWAQSQDLGREFAQEARRIHSCEAPNRAIRGQATRTELEDLLDDGIAVLPLPAPDTLPTH
jgi:hypothetical protein